MLLYQNQILQESGNIDKALKHLDDFSTQIVDKLAVKETMGELCLKLGKFSTAVPIWEGLIKRNPENTLYYQKYIEARETKDSDEIVNIYKKFQVSHVSQSHIFENSFSGNLTNPRPLDDHLNYSFSVRIPLLNLSQTFTVECSTW